MPEFLKHSDLKALGIAFSPGYLKQMEAKGEFPRRVMLGPKKHVWQKTDAERYIADKVAASKGK